LKECPQIMPLVDYVNYEPEDSNEEPRLFQVMPLAYTNGAGYKNMLSCLKKKTHHERLVFDTLQQVMKGLAYMHDQGIYHLDMKDDNILYMLDGSLRIADFGCSIKQVENDELTPNHFGDSRILSPGVYAYARYGYKRANYDVGKGEVAESFSGQGADAWSAGLYLLELLINKRLFELQGVEFLEKIKTWTKERFQSELSKIKKLQDGFSSDFRDLLGRFLTVDDQKRLLPRQALGLSLLTSQVLSEQEREQAFKQLISLQ
jgi:serine/threonine protein kinase